MSKKTINQISILRKNVDLINETPTRELALLEIMTYVKCQIMTSGLKSTQSEYVYCKTCDSEEKNPICIECSRVCHENHKLTNANRILATCYCGTICHRNENLQDELISDSSSCQLFEWNIVSNSNIFYQVIDSQKTICYFCANFCHYKADVEAKLEKTKKSEDKCNCDNVIHKEKNNLIRKFNEISKVKELSFGLLNNTQIVNTILLANSSFSFFFKVLKKSLYELSSVIKDTQQKIESTHISSSFAWALHNLYNLQEICNDDFNYFTDRIRNLLSIKFIFGLLIKKIDNKSSIILTVFNQILSIYVKFIFLKEFSKVPILKIDDLLNLHPLQRILFIRNIYKYGSIADNIIYKLSDSDSDSKVLFTIEQIFKILERLSIGNNQGYNKNLIMIIYSLFIIIQYYIQFNLIPSSDYSQICVFIENIFNNHLNSSKETTENDENFFQIQEMRIKLVAIFSQILILMLVFENDSQVEGLLMKNSNKNSPSFDIVFSHSTGNLKNEVQKLIYKNIFHSVGFIRSNYHKKYAIEFDTIFNIFQLSKSLSMEIEDLYQNQLINLKECDLQSYAMFINKSFINNQYSFIWFDDDIQSKSVKEKNGLTQNSNSTLNHNTLLDFLDFLYIETQKIENLYFSFFNFRVGIDFLIENISLSITSLFETINSHGVCNDNNINNENNEDNYFHMDYSGLKQRRNSKKEVKKENIQMAINKTYYVFSIYKILSILYSIYENEKGIYNFNNNLTASTQNFYINILESNTSLIDLIIKVLYFISQDNNDNIVLLTSSFFMKEIHKFPIDILKKFMELYLFLIKSIYEKKIRLNSINSVLNFVNSLIETSYLVDIEIEVLEIIIEIIEILSKIHLLEPSKSFTTKKLIDLIIKLTNTYSQFFSFKGYLQESFHLLNQNQNDVNDVNKKTSPYKSLKLNKLSIEVNDIRPKHDVSFRKSSFFNKNTKINTNFNANSFSFIYLKFLKTVNLLFDQCSTIDETGFLIKILKPEEVLFIILNNNKLYLPLRVEIINFFRIAYINVKISCLKSIDYRTVLFNPIQVENDDQTFSEGPKYKLLNSILNINSNTSSIDNEIELIKHELSKFETILVNSNTEYSYEIGNYLENGIFKPLLIFINKFMSIIYLLPGKYYIDFYEIVLFFLKLKLVLLENSHLFQNSSFFYLEEEQSFIKNDILYMSNSHYEIYNYHLTFSFYEKNIKTLLKKSIFESILLNFEKMNVKNIEMTIEISADHSNFHSLNNERLGLVSFDEKIKFIISKYKKDKLYIGECSYILTLNEKSEYYSSSYRSLFIKSIVYILTSNRFNEEYTQQLLWDLFKILQYDTKQSQVEISKIIKSSDYSFFNLLEKIFLFNFISLIFSQSSKSIQKDYKQALTIIKLLKYLCEEHNLFFQTLFIRKLTFEYTFQPDSDQTNDSNQSKNSHPSEDEDDLISNTEENRKISLFNYILCVISKIITLSNWSKVEFRFDEKEVSYFFDIFYSSIEFLIEMIQGTSILNLQSLFSDENENDSNVHPSKVNFKSNPYLSSCLNELKSILFHDKSNSTVIYKVRISIINFIMSFLEESNTPDKMIIFLSSFFSPNSVLDSCIATMKKLYIRLNKKHKTSSFPNKINQNKYFSEEDYENILFNKEMSDFFHMIYFEDMSFLDENPEFDLSNKLFQYIYLQGNQYNNEDSKKILSSSSEKENTEQYFVLRFFSQITKRVYISKDNSINQIIFTTNPLVQYLSETTKVSFYNNVNRSNRYEKLVSLIEYSKVFFEEIIFKSKIKRKGLVYLLSQFNSYKKFEFYIYIFIFILNLMFVIGLKVEYKVLGVSVDLNYIVKGYPDEIVYYHPVSISNVILYIRIFLILVNIALVFVYFLTKFPLIYKLEIYKYIQEKSNTQYKDSNNLDFLEKLDVFLVRSIISKNDINTFILNILFLVLPLITKSLMFIYSFQLLIILSLNKTMSNILRSVSIRGKQLVTVGLFSIIIINLFGNIGYFWFYHDYNKVFNIAGLDYTENQCEYLIQCFLFNFRYGVGTDGGINENLLVNYYYDGNFSFIGRWFNDIIFFLVVKLSLLSIVLGNVVEASAELREKQTFIEEDKHSVCFICGATRDFLEKENENFDRHINIQHSIWDYCEYLIYLKFLDIQETNAINSYVIENVEKKSISWFPYCTEGSHEEEE